MGKSMSVYMPEKEIKCLLLDIQSELEMKVRSVHVTRQDEHFHSNVTVLSNTIK